MKTYLNILYHYFIISGCFIIDEIFILIIIEKLGLGLFISFVKRIRVRIR